jgi:hypothetical protein
VSIRAPWWKVPTRWAMLQPHLSLPRCRACAHRTGEPKKVLQAIYDMAELTFAVRRFVWERRGSALCAPRQR